MTDVVSLVPPLAESEVTLDRIVVDHAARSYFLKAGHHVPFLAANPLADWELATLETTAFALIKPDAVASGLTGPICDWLEARGYEIAYADGLWRPREHQFEALYQFNLTLRNSHNQLASWWLNRQLYTLGPSVLLLLRRPGRESSVYSALVSDKGPSDPFRGRPGELRHDFTACNMTMNLFHCSDDPISTAREFLIFRHRDQLREALGRIGSSATTGRPGVAQLAAAVEPGPPVDAMDAVRRLVLRALLEADQAAGAPLADPVPRGPDWPIARRLAHLRGLLLPLKPRVEGLESGMRTALLTLLDFPHRPDLDMDQALQVLNGMGLIVPSFQRLAIVSTCHYLAEGSVRP
jgi:nucleoside diphosphate kinase